MSIEQPVRSPVRSLLQGAFDLHVHCGPSLFPRWGNAIDCARAADNAEMSGLLLKSHEAPTVGEAAAATAAVESVRVLGGVVLNSYVGGLNPAAVESALRRGGRCVWLPTIDAADHVRAFGHTGNWTKSAPAADATDNPGLSILDNAGRLLAAVEQILSLAAEHQAIVATGHVGRQEIEQLVQRAPGFGVERLLIQHPLFSTPDLDSDYICDLAARGAYIEITWLNTAPGWETTTTTDTADLLRALPKGQAVLSTDAGQADSPPPPAALSAFATALHEAGVDETTLRTALTETPRHLLGL